MSINIEELLDLPAAERFRLAELLWSSIPANAGPDVVPLTPEQRQEIDLAIAECETGAEASVPYEEVIAELRKKLPAP